MRSYEIDSAFQGQEGLKLVRQAAAEGRRYALAFVDVRMPPVGTESKRPSNFGGSIPICRSVLCTAYSDYSWNDMVVELGETDLCW